MTTMLHDRKIAFEHAAALSDLFEDVKPREPGSPYETVLDVPSWEAGTWSDRARRTRFKVAGILTVENDGYRHFAVKPRPAVLDYIKNNVLHCSDDTMMFRVVVWDDGRALVIAQHGVIIGSHYLAIIDAATLPSTGV